ncbi:MAG: ATP-binding cassette domain-containing protein [Spirochaetales bacterium]|nr:ATP-binding cassette domain-containing protein [Spirochaetales bacterium]
MLQLLNASLTLFERNVVDRAHLQLRAGDVVLLDGPTRSGKTQLLRLLAGLVKPQSGQVLCHGKPLEYHPGRRYFEERQDICCLLRRLEPLHALSCQENLELVLRLSTQLGRARIEREINSRLSQLGLMEQKYTRVEDLSVSEKIRLRLAVLSRPGAGIFLLDQALHDADSATQETGKAWIKELLKSAAIIVLTAEDQAKLELPVNRRIWLDQGRLLES